MISECRSCNGAELEPILTLGRVPLANALITKAELDRPEATYPLDLAMCPLCTLVQLTETVPPDQLFREYLYFSSFSDTMLDHARELVDRLVRERRLDGRSLAVEVGSNDGYLLQYYKKHSIPVLGIEPARNIAVVAEKERGVPTICEFFGEGLARELRGQGKRADVLHAHNVLAHVADLNGFAEGIRLLLNEDGVAVIEVPYLKDLIDRCEFDTIYHEHLCYFSVTALNCLFRRHGLVLADVERVPIHGGSLRFFVAHKENAQPKPAVLHLLEEESGWGVNCPDFYRKFSRRVEEVKKSLCKLLRDLRRDGKRLAAYGAAAKGATLLNYCGIGKETLEFVVDRSSYKQGRFMPGVHLPVYDSGKLLELMPDFVLLLTWNFADEILSQQTEYRRRGGRFIIPVPEPRVV